MSRRLAGLAVLGSLFVAAPPALAQTPAAPAPAPAPLPTGTIKLIPVDASNAATPVTFPGARLRVLGSITPYIGAQTVTVRFYHGGKLLGVRYAPVKFAGHNTGHFLAGFPVPNSFSAITVKAIHYRSDLQGEVEAPSVHVRVIPGNAPFGSRGPAVRYLQHALAGMHFAVPFSGVMDNGTGLAVMAFRKLANMQRSENADQSVFAALARGEGVFQVRYPGDGKHFEADLTHQVLAEINPGGKVRLIYTISSGKPSTPTVIGRFSIYRKDWGTNSHGMVDSNYFIRGYAIHGYADVPDYPASHGCLRVPVPDAASIFGWAQLGDRVDVYYRGGGGSTTVSGHAGP